MRTGLYIGIPSRRRKSVFNPASQVGLFSWYRGDFSTRSAGFYSSATESGTVGGSFTAPSAPVDTVQFADLKHVPSFTGVQRLLHSSAASSWSFLHNTAGNATIAARFYLKSVVSGARVLDTYNSGAAGVGIALLIVGGALQVWFGNGIASQMVSAPGAPVVGWNTVVITKTGASVAIALNGGAAGAGTIATPSDATAQATLCLGNDFGGSTPLNGFLAETLIFNTVLTATNITNLTSYLANRWSSVPGVMLFLDASKGVTLNSGNVSAWADQAVGNDVTQATAINQPEWQASRINGHPALVGAVAASPKRVTRPNFLAGALPHPLVQYYLVEWALGQPGVSYLNFSASGRCDVQALIGLPDVGIFSTSQVNTTVTPTPGGAVALEVVFNGNASAVEALQPAQAPESQTGLNPGSAAMNGLGLLGTTNATQNFVGALNTMLIVDHLPTTAGRNEIKQFLSVRGGI
jgi:hypothetical protein